MRVAAAVAVFGLVASACFSGGTPISGDVRNVGGVTMTFRVEPAVVERGQTVTLTLSLQNATGTAETLRFPSGKRYDFWITDGGREVWRWSEGMAFTQALVTEELPGQSGVSYTEMWQADVTGELRAHGELEARGYTGPLDGDLEVR